MQKTKLELKKGNIFQIHIDLMKLWAEKSMEEKKAIAFCQDIGTLPSIIYTKDITMFEGKLHIKNAFHAAIKTDKDRPIRIMHRKAIEPMILDVVPKGAIKETNLPDWAELDEIGADLQLSEEINNYTKGSHPQELLMNILF